MPNNNLRNELLVRAAPHLVCNDKTDIVIEGYPRSSNTFIVDMINVINSKSSVLSIAHHTHDIRNIMLGIALRKPTIVLIRRPEDAILSFVLFSQRPIADATNRYENFYSQVLELPTQPLILEFSKITTDFNSIIAQINTFAGLEIPLSSDLAEDSAIAHSNGLKRAKKIHGERALMKVGGPTIEREKEKAKLRPEVHAYLKTRPEIDELYNTITKA